MRLDTIKALAVAVAVGSTSVTAAPKPPHHASGCESEIVIEHQGHRVVTRTQCSSAETALPKHPSGPIGYDSKHKKVYSNKKDKDLAAQLGGLHAHFDELADGAEEDLHPTVVIDKTLTVHPIIHVSAHPTKSANDKHHGNYKTSDKKLHARNWWGWGE